MRLFPALIAGLALWSSVAHADPKDDARRHFLAGLQAAKDQQFQVALSEFLAAQKAYPHPNSLYNIARAYTDMGDLPKAIEYYQLFRDAAPSKAADVEPVIAVLEARLRKDSAPAAMATGGDASATSAELARLAAIAEELARMSQSIQERTASADGGGAVAANGPADADGQATVGEAAALETQADFLEDAYERVVVTASRYGQSPLDSPSTVTILTEDDIRQSGATNIPDVLRQVVGVDVMSMSASQPDVSIRGFNRELSNKVLVLVDGRSVYLDILGTVLWDGIPIALEEIERIEIIRGPGSAVYGANAVTGVINIITRTPGTGGNLVKVEGGTPGYGQGSAILSGRTGANAYRFSMGFHQTGRWSQEEPVESSSALESTVENQSQAGNRVRANGRIDRTLGTEGFASLSGGYVTGFSDFYVIGALGEWGIDYDLAHVRGDVAYGPVHLRSFWNGMNSTTGPWAEAAGARKQGAGVDFDTVDVEIEANHSFETGAVSHRLNAGLGYRYKNFRWELLKGGGTPIEEHHQSAFVQEQAEMGKVALVGSLRLDRHPLVDLDKTISPRGAAIVRVADRTSVRATAGTSFRAPSAMESYVDFNQLTPIDGVFVETLGNEELLPERIMTAELGVHDESTSFHRLDATAYYNRVSDLIYVQDVTATYAFYDPTQNGFEAGETQFGNLPQIYDAYGLEIEGHYFPADGLDLYANVDLQQVTETEGGQSVSDTQTSPLKVNAGATYRTPWRFDVAAHVHYLSKQTWRLREFDSLGQLFISEVDVPARTIPAVRLAARPFADDALEVSATAWNFPALFDDASRFREHPKGQLVGGRAHAAVSYEF